MFIVQLVYASSTKNISPEVIEEILSKARKNNEKNGVTGILYFNSNFFLQCLEGSREKVNLIYHKILNDPRHTHPMLLAYQTVDERSFANWNMAYVGENKLHSETFYKYSLSPTFDPYTMSRDSARIMLNGLSKAIKQ